MLLISLSPKSGGSQKWDRIPGQKVQLRAGTVTETGVFYYSCAPEGKFFI